MIIQLDILMPVFGKSGVENVVNRIGPYLQQNGFHVRVVSLMWKGQGAVHNTIEFFPLSDGTQIFSYKQFADCYAEFLRTHGSPDIILATSWPIMTVVARLSIQKTNYRACKIISWPHQPIDIYVTNKLGGIESFNISDAVFALNQKTLNIIKAHSASCNVVLAKNPISLTHYCIQPRNGWKDKTLLFVGRISAQKRLDIILQAISRTKEIWKLILIGEGEEQDDLPELIRLLNIEDQVILTGWQNDPWQSAKGISALVMASDFECLPLVALESLASGIPVISTPVDGISEIIKPGVNGFLYPFEDIDGLAGILDAMSDGILPEISSEACRESVMEFEEERVLRDFREKILKVWNEA